METSKRAATDDKDTRLVEDGDIKWVEVGDAHWPRARSRLHA
jgi:hypothetical protein